MHPFLNEASYEGFFSCMRQPVFAAPAQGGNLSIFQFADFFIRDRRLSVFFPETVFVRDTVYQIHKLPV